MPSVSAIVPFNPPFRHPRVLLALGLSLALHGALLAGWRPFAVTPARIATFEPIEVALVADHSSPVISTNKVSPRPAVAPVPPPTEASGGDIEPYVEARSDVASLDNPKPPYPLAARRRGIEGRVLLSAHVSAEGVCTEVRLTRSSGHALLDESAANTVNRWRFLPARRGETAVASWVDVPVSFRLEK
jgi:protein TonB